MCKLLFLLLLINGFWGYFGDPFLPFLPQLDTFRDYPGLFESSLRVLFLSSGIGLLLNYKVRTMALLLGVTIIVFLLSSKPIFRNHIFICGCVFLLSGLSRKDHYPWLLYLQLSLVYFGAVLNKIVQIDWWDGTFMHNWLFNARDNSIYKLIDSLIPGRYFARILSWSSIAIESSIGIMLLIKRKHKLVFWVILLFHTMIFTITGFRFGHFFEDILIYLLVFMTWPEGSFNITVNPRNEIITPAFISLINWNGQFKITILQEEAGPWLSLGISDVYRENLSALGYLILYTPATYFFLLFFDSLIRYWFNPVGEHIITTLWLWGGILFFLYISTKNRTRMTNEEN
jgi:hypothetical protein